MSDRIGGWCCTFSGIAFYPLDPRPEEVNIDDIAHALSMLCRFGGHVSRFYSVAEHSVRGTHALRDMGYSKEVQRAFLLHDAAEAYLVDVPRPIKASLVGYKEIEAKLEAVIGEVFDVHLTEDEKAVVKDMDNVMLATEKRDLMPSRARDGGMLPSCGPMQAPLPDYIRPMSQKDAKNAFYWEWAEVRSAQ